MEALETGTDARNSILVPGFLLIEFSTLLRKLSVRRGLSAREVGEIIDLVGQIIIPVPDLHGLHATALDLATDLGQSDTFDAAAYLTAQHYRADFWTSDRRFANAAERAGLPGFRYIP